MLTFTSAEIDGWLAAFFYPFCRILALATSAPVYSHASVPVPVRIGLALALTLVVAPTLPAPAFVSPLSLAGLLLIVQQIIAGVTIGFAMTVVFAAADVAGDLIGLQMGLSFASFIDPQNSNEAPVIGNLLGIVLMLVFLALDGHLMLIAALVDSFTAIPIASGAPPGLDLRTLGMLGADVFAIGLRIALPVIATLLLANVALGVLSRTAPQLNLFAVGFPATLTAGALALFAAMPALVPVLEGAVRRGLAAVGH
jgi:flagellar biosynthetic protein FliR